MYYEEKIIEGYLCYRTHPKGQFNRLDQKQLTTKIVELKKELNQLKSNLQKA